MHNHTGCICSTFLHCDFSWVSLTDEMQIVWTYAIFLQSDFSNAPSKQLSKQKQSHIGCICAIFLLSEIAYVSLSYSHKRLHSRIRCIGLTFRQNEFSYVSSSGLPKKRHSHIGCICLIFPHCGISNVLSEVFIVVTVVSVSHFFLSCFPIFCCAWAELFLSSTSTKDFFFVGHRQFQCHVTYHCQSGKRWFEPWNVICNFCSIIFHQRWAFAIDYIDTHYTADWPKSLLPSPWERLHICIFQE